MTRNVRKVDMGDGRHHIEIIYEDEPSLDEGFIRTRRIHFLNEFVSNQGLWGCETKDFENMEMSHNGIGWVIKITADIVDKS